MPILAPFPLEIYLDAPVQKYIDELLDWVASRKIKLNDIITHRLSIEEVPHAYDIIKNKKEDCVKVVLKP